MKRKFLALISMLLLAAMFCGCTGSGSGQNQSSEPESTEAEVQMISLDSYTVIRPDESETEFQPALDLYNALHNELSNVKIAVDWVKPGTEIPAQAKEILVGKTNRAESSEFTETIKTQDWHIEYHPESGRITILGGSEEVLSKAVAWFIEKYVQGKKEEAKFPSNMQKVDSCGDYQYKTMTINGSPIDTYTIVIPVYADLDEKYAAEYIRDIIADRTGIAVEIKIESLFKDKNAIYIGNTTALKNAGYTADVSARVSVSGNNVFVYGEGGYEVAAAKRLIASLSADEQSKELSLSIKGDTVYENVTAKVEGIAEFGELPVAIVDQKNACAAIYDVMPVYKAAVNSSSAEPELKYTFAPSTAKGFSVDSTYANRIDEFRIRYSEILGCYVMLFTSSSGYIGIAKYPSGEKIWEESLPGYGPHSIEYLPNGLVALALSGNGDEDKAQVRIYNTSNKIAKHSEMTLTGCHAVLWDEVRSILWAYGSKDLIALEVDESEAKPKLTKIAAYTGYVDTAIGGHDMSAVPGDSDLLIISGSKGCELVCKDQMLGGFLCKGQLSASATKCLSALPAPVVGTKSEEGLLFFVRTYAQNVYAEHDTDNFDLFWVDSLSAAPLGSVNIKLPSRAFYKARALDYSYCPDLP